MKKFIKIFACLIIILSLSACGENKKETKSTNNKSEKKEEILNLYGTWKQTNSESNEDYQQAEIKEDGTMTIYWISEDSKSLYWAGSFEAPTTSSKTYSWTSNNDKEQTDSSLLASSDDTKDFKYENGTLSYEASAMGTTKTIKLKKE